MSPFLDLSVLVSLTLVLGLVRLVAARHGTSAATRHLLCVGGLVIALCVPIMAALVPSISWAILAPSAAAAEPLPVSVPTATEPHTWSWLGGLWFAGFAFVVAKRVREHRALRRLERESEVLAGPVWSAVVNTCREDLGLKRRVRVLRHPAAETPATWGILRPVLLLPRDAHAWSPDRRRAILLHELAHVLRSDVLLQELAALACAVYWFHPLAWSLAAQMREEREKACDDFVLRAGARPSGYAACLLDMYRRLTHVPLGATAACALHSSGSSQMERRLNHMLEPSSRRRESAWVPVLTLALLAGTSMPLAALELTERPTEDTAREQRLKELRAKNTRDPERMPVGEPEPEERRREPIVPWPQDDPERRLRKIDPPSGDGNSKERVTEPRAARPARVGGGGGGAKPLRRVARDSDSASASDESVSVSASRNGERDPETERKLERRMRGLLDKLRSGASGKELEREMERMMDETLRELGGGSLPRGKRVTARDSDSDSQEVTSRDGRARARARATSSASSSSSSSSSDSARSGGR